MKKRILAVFLVLAMAFALSACGGKSAGGDGEIPYNLKFSFEGGESMRTVS